MTFFKKIYRKFMFWLMQSDFWAFVLLTVLPKLRWSNEYSEIDGKAYNKGYDLLQSGDIILTYSANQASSAVPGRFSHAELCLTKDRKIETVGMTRFGFSEHTFFDVCKTSDRATIVRIKSWRTNKYISRLIAWCQEWRGAVYDQEFKLGNKALYCFELIYESDKLRLAEFKLDDLLGLGREYISGEGIINSPHATVIWDSAGELAPAE